MRKYRFLGSTFAGGLFYGNPLNVEAVEYGKVPFVRKHIRPMKIRKNYLKSHLNGHVYDGKIKCVLHTHIR